MYYSGENKQNVEDGFFLTSELVGPFGEVTERHTSRYVNDYLSSNMTSDNEGRSGVIRDPHGKLFYEDDNSGFIHEDAKDEYYRRYHGEDPHDYDYETPNS